VAGLLGLMMTATLGGLAGPAGAAEAAAAPQWPAQVAHPAAATCPAGQKLVVPTSGVTDSQGVARIYYQADPGAVAYVAPHLQNASQVTPALLADLGMASAATQLSAQAKQRDLTGPQTVPAAVSQVLAMGTHPTAASFCQAAAPLQTAESAPATAAASTRATVPAAGSSTPTATHHFSGNWSGYYVTEGDFGTGINAVTGDWTVPSSLTSTAYKPSAEVTWIGLGGNVGESSDVWGLVQEGTSMVTNQGYQSWFEEVGDSEDPGSANAPCGSASNTCGIRWQNTGQVAPGDVVGGAVWWQSTTEPCFNFVDDTHSGGSFDLCMTVMPAGVPYDHTSAEWINEFPSGPYNYYDAPSTTHFTEMSMNASASGGTWQSPFNYPYVASVLLVPGTPYVQDGAPSTACSSTGVESFPEDAANQNAANGQSTIVTCPTGTGLYEDGLT
jgi:hypothetical protein